MQISAEQDFVQQCGSWMRRPPATEPSPCLDDCKTPDSLIAHLKPGASDDEVRQIVDPLRVVRSRDRLLIDLGGRFVEWEKQPANQQIFARLQGLEAVSSIQVEPVIAIPEQRKGDSPASPVPNDEWRSRLAIPPLPADMPRHGTVAVIDQRIGSHPNLPNEIVEHYVIADNVDVDECSGDGCCRKSDQTTPVEESATHGIEVLGTIAGVGVDENGQSMAGIAAPQRIIAIDPYTYGCAPARRVAAALRCAVEKGANVINLSMGSFPGSTAPTSIDRAMKFAADEGALVVVSAGNSMCNLDEMSLWPASTKAGTSLTVGTVTARDGSFMDSNCGSRAVELVVPIAGESVRAPKVCQGKTCSSGMLNKTSAAAAIVSGAAALVWSYPEYARCSASQLRILIMANARRPSRFACPYISHEGGVLDLSFLGRPAAERPCPPADM